MSKLWVWVLLAVFGLTGCAVEFENTQAAREIAEAAKPPELAGRTDLRDIAFAIGPGEYEDCRFHDCPTPPAA